MTDTEVDKLAVPFNGIIINKILNEFMGWSSVNIFGSVDHCGDVERRLKHTNTDAWRCFRRAVKDVYKKIAWRAYANGAGMESVYHTCPDPDIVAHALAEVIVEAGLGE